MVVTAARTWTNVAFNSTITPDDPPLYLPDESGQALPPGKTSWQLAVDQSNVPADQSYGFHLELQRTAWTDKAGFDHPDGEWLHKFGSDDMVGGPISLRAGGTTFINHIGGGLFAIGPDGQPIEPYPTRIRFKITRIQPWLFPTIVFKLG